MEKLKILTAIFLALSLASCSGSSRSGNYKNYGEQIDDQKILYNLRMEFRNNPQIPSNDIHIAVDRGIVQLSGFVRSHTEADLAILSAQNTRGVKDVVNNLVILSSSDYAARRAAAEARNTGR